MMMWWLSLIIANYMLSMTKSMYLTLITHVIDAEIPSSASFFFSLEMNKGQKTSAACHVTARPF